MDSIRNEDILRERERERKSVEGDGSIADKKSINNSMKAFWSRQGK